MDNFDKNIPRTVGALMRDLYRPDYPDYIMRLLNQVKGWLTRTYRIDDVDLPYWEVLREDPEFLFGQLNWLSEKAALLPAVTPPPPQAEAVVLSLGEVDLTDAMRLTVDYSLIFSENKCRRVWIVSDCWIPFDILAYGDHIKAMDQRGITIRFIIATAWGWVEMPVSALAQRPLPGSSSSDGGRRRRRDDD